MVYANLEKRKEYNRQRAQKVYEDFVARKSQLMEVFGNKCFLCGCSAKKGFHFHHVSYTDESSYPRNSKAMSTRLKRLAEAEANPERFKLLCAKCHGSLELIRVQLKRGIDIDLLMRLVLDE